jgi:DNA-binding CsgD family transcriptional regulator
MDSECFSGPGHNIPTDLTTFVGRQHESDDVRRLITAHRLVTLTGPGGVGKTRLAATIAADLTNKEIATRLSVAQRTAEAHIQHILTKLGFTGRAQIAAWAARRNAVSPTPGSINAPEK